MYQNIADEQIDAGESASFIIAQMKAFNITAEDSMHIIDAVNEVSNNFAVSSADLATNLGKVSSTLAITGTSFEESLGMLTAITEITRNASMASRGLKQISSRLTQTLDESSSTGKKLKEIYSDLGISLVDEEGQIRSTYDILKDLAAQWDSLSTNQQEYIALTSAGSNQVQNFTALLGNFNQAVKATETAEKSAGSATKENAAYMESLEARLQGLRAEWQNLTTEGGVINKFIKLILSAGTAVLKFANSDAVKFTVKVAAFTAGIYLAVKAVVALSGALWGLAVSNPILLGITAITAGAIGLSKAIKTNKERIEELKETLANTDSEIESIRAEYQQLASQDTADLTEEERKRLGVLQEQLNVLKAQRKEQLQQLGKEIEAPTFSTVTGTEMVGGGLGFRTITETKTANELIDTLADLGDVTADTRAELDEYWQTLDQVYTAGIPLDKQQRDFYFNYQRLTEKTNLMTEAEERYGAVIGGYVSQEIDRLTQEYGKNTRELNKHLSGLNAQELALQAVRNAAIAYINSQNGMQISLDATNDEILKNLQYLRTQAQVAYESAYIVAAAGRNISPSAGAAFVESNKALADAAAKLNKLDSLISALNTNLTGSSSGGSGGSGGYNGAVKDTTSSTKKATDATRDLTDALKDQSSALEQAAEFMITRLDEEISALEAQKQALQDTNQELEDQLELEEALDALARAKANKVLTYSGGQFIYSADASAVGEAQKRVDEIRRKQAQQAQIDAIDERIDAIKAEQDNWRKVKNAYNDYLGAQQLGVSAEGDAWKKRIGQAEQYANQYLKIMQTMAGVESGAISLSTGKSILASSKNFGKNLSGSSAYKSLLEPSSSTLTTSRIASMSTADLKRVVNQYFGDISLPNVSNAEQFVEDLKNFQQFASQSATSR